MVYPVYPASTIPGVLVLISDPAAVHVARINLDPVLSDL